MARKHLKVLVFTNNERLKKLVVEVLEGKLIKLTFTDKTPAKVGRRVLRAHDSFCVPVPMHEDKVTLFVQSYRAIDDPKPAS